MNVDFRTNLDGKENGVEDSVPGLRWSVYIVAWSKENLGNENTVRK